MTPDQRARHNARQRAYNERNRAAVNDRQRARYQADPTRGREARRATSRAWAAEHRDVMRERSLAWAKANPELHAAKVARRRAAKLNATPAWANQDAIRAIYRLAQEVAELTGVEHHVDHIIPLQGEFVCGLHVESNLQVLPGAANKSKGNKHG